MNAYPCKYLTKLEAVYLWQLAEENYAESRANKGEPFELQRERPARMRLRRARDLLSRDAYHDVVALMWLGRGDHDSYTKLRKNARSEKYTDYVASKGLLLHAYFRTSLV